MIPINEYVNTLISAKRYEIVEERMRWKNDPDKEKEFANYAAKNIRDIKGVKNVIIKDWHGTSIEITTNDDIESYIEDIKKSLNNSVNYFENKYKNSDISWSIKVSTKNSILVVTDCYISYED